jgi:hypothetical protein
MVGVFFGPFCGLFEASAAPGDGYAPEAHPCADRLDRRGIGGIAHVLILRRVWAMVGPNPHPALTGLANCAYLRFFGPRKRV